ncbi:MAG: nucleotide-binding protein [Phycisphaerae bacterium]|nr:nucleotide-binding protein [Phycisphaerae bacterium]
MPSHGRTIIEKFEDVAETVDVVFVLLTPDDNIASPRAPNESKRRARQNVIFELGYFYAKLQRSGGRVILLYRGHIELPSGISPAQ